MWAEELTSSLKRQPNKARRRANLYESSAQTRTHFTSSSFNIQPRLVTLKLSDYSSSRGARKALKSLHSADMNPFFEILSEYYHSSLAQVVCFVKNSPHLHSLNTHTTLRYSDNPHLHRKKGIATRQTLAHRSATHDAVQV